MHKVAVIAMHGVVPFDLAIPCEVFDRLRASDFHDAYEVRVCAETKDVKAGAFDLRVQWVLEHTLDADTVIVPGITNPMMPISQGVIEALRAAKARGARVASICTGAFVLAAAGLLDGMRATTHWLAAAELAARYPAVTVDARVLFIDNGAILTSAGAAAGLDLCLHMVRCDYGAAMAARAARLAVTPLERDGGQAQYIVHEPPASDATLRPLLNWLEEHLRQRLSLQQIANHGALSTRTLTRRFREQVGTSPMQWLLSARIRRARELLETTDLSTHRVAIEVGFESVSAFRDRFHQDVGTSPAEYRRTFGNRTDVEERAPSMRSA